jgi:Flp pilus assembly protein TadD
MERVARRKKVLLSLAVGAFFLAASPVVFASSDDCAPLLEEAQELLTGGHATEARDVILAATRKCSQNAQTYNLLGIAYDEQRLYKQAQAAYQKASSF